MIKTAFYLLTFVFSATISLGQNIPRLYRKATSAIVKISTIDHSGLASSGTGFFIDEKTIVTCHHVVDHISQMNITTIDHRPFTVDSVIASNKEADLIKFTVKEENKTWLKLADKLPSVGETVYIIGNPNGYDFSISNGLVSAIREMNNVQVLQTNASASPGSSGGPLLDKRGKVVGIVSYVKLAGQNLNFAATSINAIHLTHDQTITALVPAPTTFTPVQMDSVIDLADQYIQARQYQKALDLLLPAVQSADRRQALAMNEQMANAYFFLQDYTKSAQYFEMLIDKLHETQPRTNTMVWAYAQALHKLAMCHYTMGDRTGAVDILAKAAEVTTTGYENDSERKGMYQLQLQQVYATDAVYKYALDRKWEACVSWKQAKNLGYEKDDFQLDDMCE